MNNSSTHDGTNFLKCHILINKQSSIIKLKEYYNVSLKSYDRTRYKKFGL